MSEIHSSYERDVSGEAPLFVEGKCSACGCTAQRRVYDETWFHVNVFDPYTVRRAVECSAPREKFSIFIQEKSKSRRKKFKDVEPHYRTVVETVPDWEHVDEKGNVPLKTVERPILCTCTNSNCPGWGTPLPDAIRNLRSET